MPNDDDEDHCEETLSVLMFHIKRPADRFMPYELLEVFHFEIPAGSEVFCLNQTLFMFH